MLPELKYMPVNWVDGMKINKLHFQQADSAMLDHLRDAITLGLNNFNFGLLSPLPGETSSLKIDFSKDHQQISIKLSACRAVTRGGARIEILDSKMPSFNYPLDKLQKKFSVEEMQNSHSYDIILSVNPHERIPIGSPDPEEIPPRHPNNLASYTINIVSSSQSNKSDYWAYHLPLGRLKVIGGEVNWDEYYIPPCAAIDNHPDLKDLYDDFGDSISKLGANATKLTQKIKSRGQTESLPRNIGYLSEQVVYFLAANMATYKMTLSQMPPVYLVEFIMKFAHLFRSMLSCMPINEKEEMGRYFSDWTEMTPGALENILEEVVFLEYEHFDMQPSIQLCGKFLKTIEKLFDKLSALEIIGKAKFSPEPEAPKKGILRSVKKEKKTKWGF